MARRPRGRPSGPFGARKGPLWANGPVGVMTPRRGRRGEEGRLREPCKCDNVEVVVEL